MEIEEVNTHDVYGEIWRRLLWFTTPQYSKRSMAKRSNAGKPKDLEKCTETVALCIKQAKDYFDAANSASNLTRGEMLYYGCYSLAAATILLKGFPQYYCLPFEDTGQGWKKHHGLSPPSRSGSDLLEYTSSVRANGTAPLFARLLPPDTVSYPYYEQWIDSGPLTSWGIKPHEGFDRSELSGKRRLIDIMFEIPELTRPLENAVKKSLLKPASLVFTKESANWKVRFWVHNVNRDWRPDVAEAWPTPAYSKDEPPTIVFVRSAGQDDWENILPDLRQALNSDLFCYKGRKKRIPEGALWLTGMYFVGMFSRYYVDEWAAFLDKNPALVNTLFDACTVKFPLLVLDAITETKHDFGPPSRPWEALNMSNLP